MPRFSYLRHFTLLCCASVLLAAVLSVWTAPINLDLALYGALHGSAVVGAVDRPGAMIRRMVFVLIAALLSVVTFYIGIRGAALFPGGVAFFAMFILTSALGAFSYAILIRRWWMPAIDLGTLAWIAAGCVLATVAGLFIGARSQHMHLWLTLFWWYAFSSGLCIADKRSRAASMRWSKA